jgi:hypothetical protein
MNKSRIATPVCAQSTATEVIRGIDLRGKRAIVTGSSSGIGIETARALASANAEVTLAVRNIEAGQRTANDISSSTGNKQVLVAPLDLANQASISAFIANWNGPLHILVNNAGMMASLAIGLHDALAAAKGVRIAIASDFDGPAADGAPYRKKFSGKYSHRNPQGHRSLCAARSPAGLCPGCHRR